MFIRPENSIPKPMHIVPAVFEELPLINIIRTIPMMSASGARLSDLKKYRKLSEFASEIVPLFLRLDPETAVKTSGKNKVIAKFLTEFLRNDHTALSVDRVIVFTDKSVSHALTFFPSFELYNF